MAQLFWSAEKRKQADLTQHRQRSARLSSLAPEQAALEFDRHCKYCDALLIPYPYDYSFNGRDIRQWLFKDNHGCAQEQVALTAQQVQTAQEQAAAQLAEYQARLKRAGLVGWLGQVTFANWENRQDWPEAAECKRRVMRYCEAVLSGTVIQSHNWLILYGNYGNGKSRLAASVIRAALDAGLPRCYFRVWPNYLERIKASWERENSERDGGEPQETEADIARELKDGNIVVIDDLDKKPATDWTKGTLYSVLGHRYNAELPTILTFNYSPTQADPKARGRLALESYLGGAVLDRVTGATYDIIEFSGPSYRSGVTLGA